MNADINYFGVDKSVSRTLQCFYRFFPRDFCWQRHALGGYVILHELHAINGCDFDFNFIKQSSEIHWGAPRSSRYKRRIDARREPAADLRRPGRAALVHRHPPPRSSPRRRSAATWAPAADGLRPSRPVLGRVPLRPITLSSFTTATSPPAACCWSAALVLCTPDGCWPGPLARPSGRRG